MQRFAPRWSDSEVVTMKLWGIFWTMMVMRRFGSTLGALAAVVPCVGQSYYLQPPGGELVASEAKIVSTARASTYSYFQVPGDRACNATGKYLNVHRREAAKETARSCATIPMLTTKTF
jgi:hypothetical protein